MKSQQVNERLQYRPNPDSGIKIAELSRCGWVRAAVVAATVLALAPVAARAEQRVAWANGLHTSTVRVTVGKTEDVRTDQNLADITVGDPDVADVNPLTDHALSILGKKIGTTRVTAYGPDKKAVGVFLGAVDQGDVTEFHTPPSCG